MNIKKIIFSITMLLAMASSIMAQTTDEKGNDLDSLYAQKLLKTGVAAPDFILPMPNGSRMQLSEFKGKYVLLDFWATWCGPCRAIAPYIEELAKEYDGKIVVGKCDVEENDDIVMEFGVRNIPTILFFKNGEVVDRLVGGQSKSAIQKKFEALL